MFSPEVQSRMAHLRAKVATGTITEEELAESVRLMRQDRNSALQAQTAAKESKGRKAKAPVNVADLFGDLAKL